MFADGFRSHRAQIKLQAAREYRDRNFLRVGGRQHEFEVFGRLFQRFQHRIECRIGEHVNLVNHEHLEAPLHGFINRLF